MSEYTINPNHPLCQRKFKGNKIPFEERFWSHVPNRPAEGCWEWNEGNNDRARYGGMHVQGVRWWAHRLSYELFVGPIPKGMCVCHKCDNRRCIRPDHLFLGTKGDNAFDMAQKGRHGAAILTPATAAELYRRWKCGEATVEELAKKYKLRRVTVWGITRGRAWRHATGAPPYQATALPSKSIRIKAGGCRALVMADFYTDGRMPEVSIAQEAGKILEVQMATGESVSWLRFSKEQAKSLHEQLGSLLL